MTAVTYRVRPVLDDEALSGLQATAFGDEEREVSSRSRRLAEHSLTWVAALDGGALVGFVNVCWDGGRHAFLLDTAVEPRWQGRGIGSELVRRAAAEARAAGCDWLHVDCEPRLVGFYGASLGFRRTDAALLDLRDKT
jgi:predicted N-acetyltransferase YhbS